MNKTHQRQNSMAANIANLKTKSAKARQIHLLCAELIKMLKVA